MELMTSFTSLSPLFVKPFSSQPTTVHPSPDNKSYHNNLANFLNPFLQKPYFGRFLVQISRKFSRVCVYKTWGSDLTCCMASGPLLGGGGGGDGSSREKQRWTDSNKVYTRKSFNKSGVSGGGGGGVSKKTLLVETPQSEEEANLSSQQQISDSSSLKVVSGMAPNRDPAPPGNGSVRGGDRSGFAKAENRVTINLGTKPKQEIRELRKKLASELEQVRSMVKKLEAKELQLGVSGYSHSQLSVNDPVDNDRLMRVNSDVASVVLQDSRPLHQLSVSVVENSQGGVSDVVEKEKRTPKVNKYYRNSDFISGKDKFPPPESNKKSKSHSSKKHGHGGGGNYGFGMDKSNPVFMECTSLLEKLMKHKHGWVFNKPVDVKLLGLHDYYTIIKHPMDLGTVKTRLNKNWYKSPKEFAEDVRLTFRNAMTYNPKGQDVHVMAELLLKMFEDGWAVIEVQCNLNPRFEDNYDIGAPTPTSKRTPAPPPFNEMRKTLDRSESTTFLSESRPKPSGAPSGRTPAPKKPKAKEPNKRDMTYEEKQRLSMNLQSLPPEKLDNVVQIIRRRSSTLCQRDDEIEVDIDVVDPETLWELDRFVTNYKKSLSKNKRKAELAMQAREPEQTAQEMNPKPAVVEATKETKSDEKDAVPSSPVQGEKQGDNASRSSSSSSSSSDSGSSSTDSDSDSSSASDAGPA